MPFFECNQAEISWQLPQARLADQGKLDTLDFAPQIYVVLSREDDIWES